MESLVIFGDSWGCGAWASPSGLLIPNGDQYLEKQLSRLYNVINHSVGGKSNHLSVCELSQLVIEHPTKVLVIQTDPLRDVVREYWSMTSKFSDIFKGIDLTTFAEIQAALFYYQLDSIAERLKIKINIAGGCSDISQSVVNYKNLNVVCHSWFELLSEGCKYTPSVFSTSTNLGIVLEGNSKADKEILNRIYEKHMIIDKQRGKLFGGGKDDHPSKDGIDLLISTIINKLI